ncbi:MAG: hypothetical protein AAF362_21370, partial [Pseudomonadota bacterium]
VKGTGLGLMVLLVLRAAGQFLSLRFIKASTSLVTALVVALILARFGQDIAAFVASHPVQPDIGTSQG